MLNSIKHNLILPLATRIGTLIAGILVPYGVHADSVEMITMGIVGIGLVAVDIVGQLVTRRGE